MSGFAFFPPQFVLVNSAGRPYTGATAHFYAAGTETPITIYSDSALAVPHTNPVTADAAGAFPAIFIDPAGSDFKVRFKTSGSVLIRETDNLPANSLTAHLVGATLWRRTPREISGGIVPTDYAKSPSDGYDVRRSGAAGNGTDDDTTALRNACKAAGAWARVYIDASLTCLVSGPIVDAALGAYAQGQTWYGGGKIVTADGQDYDVFDCKGITDVTVEGLRAESGMLGDTYTEPTGYSTTDFTARFFTARSGAHRCQLNDCYIIGFQSAARIGTGAASLGCRVINNDIVNPDGWGVNVQTDSDDCIVAKNRISGVAHEHGIYVAGSDGNNIARAIITENIVTDSDNDGIKLSYADDAIVADNHSYANGGSGIYLTTGCNRADVHDNICASNTGQGIQVYDGMTTCDRNRITRNTIRKNVKDGISINSASPGAVSRTWIVGNDIEDNDQNDPPTGTYYGVVVAGATTTTKTLIEGNRIADEAVGVRTASGIDSDIGQNVYENCTTGISDNATTTKIRHVTSGATSVADGGTITHGHPKTPTRAIVTASVAGEFASVTAIGATTITVAVKKHDGTAGTTQTVYWTVAG